MANLLFFPRPKGSTRMTRRELKFRPDLEANDKKYFTPALLRVIRGGAPAHDSVDVAEDEEVDRPTGWLTRSARFDA